MDETPDPYGLRTLLASKRIKHSAFARAMGSTPQTLNNWFERGLPGNKVYTASDVLGMSADELRPYTAPGRQPATDIDAEVRRFSALFRRQDAKRQAEILARLRDMARE
jgi:hypothetical protein